MSGTPAQEPKMQTHRPLKSGIPSTLTDTHWGSNAKTNAMQGGG